MTSKDEIKVTIDLARELAEGINELSSYTRVPKVAYFREAVEDLLQKYEATLREARKKQKSRG